MVAHFHQKQLMAILKHILIHKQEMVNGSRQNSKTVTLESQELNSKTIVVIMQNELQVIDSLLDQRNVIKLLQEHQTNSMLSIVMLLEVISKFRPQHMYQWLFLKSEYTDHSHAEHSSSIKIRDVFCTEILWLVQLLQEKMLLPLRKRAINVTMLTLLVLFKVQITVLSRLWITLANVQTVRNISHGELITRIAHAVKMLLFKALKQIANLTSTNLVEQEMVLKTHASLSLINKKEPLVFISSCSELTREKSIHVEPTMNTIKFLQPRKHSMRLPISTSRA